ncbi:MAG TPA: hypothetical protein VIZ65_13800 [Cellvibrionaceae bacterium]
MRLNSDDIIRRAFIGQLICDFRLNFAAIEQRFLLNFKQYFARVLAELITLPMLSHAQLTNTIFVLLSQNAYLAKQNYPADQAKRHSKII